MIKLYQTFCLNILLWHHYSQHYSSLWACLLLYQKGGIHMKKTQEKAPTAKTGEQTLNQEKISKKIARQIGIPTCIIFLIVAVVMAVVVKLQLDTSNEKELTLESQSASNELNTFFQQYMKSVSHLAVNPQVKSVISSASPNTPIIQTTDYPSVLQYMVNMQQEDSDNIMAVWIASVDANVLTQSDGYTSGKDFQITSREWYSVTKTKSVMLTKPYVDASTGTNIISAAAPISDASGKVIGVAGLDLSLEHVDEILSQFTIGKTGYVIMTASDGTVIYHPDSSLIQQSLNKMDISSNVTNLVSSGKDGFVKYKINKTTKYGYVTAIDNTGYVVFSSLSSGEYSQSLVMTIIIMVIIFVIGAAIIFIGINKMASSITKPIETLDAAAKELADGNLDVHLEVTTNDEIGNLGHSIQRTVERLKEYIAYIDEISDVLAKMADGTLAVHLNQEYVGEFSKIKDALLNISASMTDIMTGITESSNQVSAGSDDLAKAAQTLAEGATNQAASVEELVATTDNIVTELQNSKEDALNCASEAKDVSTMANNSKQQMQAMLDAMSMISETSNKVVSIIHTIEEIADQTNLLSLNASIEAARAGEAGRGFAVVASEISSLAAQSSEAAANSKELIGVSINEIEKGVNLANEVTDILQSVVTNIDNLSNMVTHTAELSVEQEENMKQMQAGIDNIAQAVQDTSATAQESSATSEELAAQAEVLTDLIKKFDLSK